MARPIERPDPEHLAILALSFIASEPERLERFLALTGLGPETIRGAANSPGFLIAVLDHVAQDEGLLRAFALQHEMDPAVVARAYAMVSRRGEEGMD